VAAARRQFIQKEHPMVRQRHLAGQRHVAPADQADSRERMMRGATRAGRDEGRAGAGAAGDAVEAGGLEGFGQAHRRQNGGQAANPPGSARESVGMGAHQLVGTALAQPGLGTHRQSNRRSKALTVQVACNDSLSGLQKFADGEQEIIRIIFKDHMGGPLDFHHSGAGHGFQHLSRNFRA
jgi:hypothetical protein